MTKAGLDEKTLEGLNDWMINAIPLKKLGTAEDVAEIKKSTSTIRGYFSR